MLKHTFMLSVMTVAMASSSSVRADKAPTSTEVLTHEQIKSGVDARLPDIKGCMKSAGSAKGKLVVRFGVLPSGHTVDASVREPSSNGALDKCIAQSAKGWVFATRGASAPVQGVDYPFVFSAPAPVAAAPQGTLTREEIVKAISVVMPKVGDCLDEARLKKSDVTGVVTAEIHVGVDGKVASLKQLGSTTNYAPVDACVMKQVQTLEFPKPQGGAGLIIEYPFKLEARPQPKK